MPEILSIIFTAEDLLKASSYFVPHLQSFSLLAGREREAWLQNMAQPNSTISSVVCLFIFSNKF
jgi:hypothetical protein